MCRILCELSPEEHNLADAEEAARTCAARQMASVRMSCRRQVAELLSVPEAERTAAGQIDTGNGVLVAAQVQAIKHAAEAEIQEINDRLERELRTKYGASYASQSQNRNGGF